MYIGESYSRDSEDYSSDDIDDTDFDYNDLTIFESSDENIPPLPTKNELFSELNELINGIPKKQIKNNIMSSNNIQQMSKQNKEVTPWFAYVAKIEEENPGILRKDALKLASETYVKKDKSAPKTVAKTVAKKVAKTATKEITITIRPRDAVKPIYIVSSDDPNYGLDQESIIYFEGIPTEAQILGYIKNIDTYKTINIERGSPVIIKKVKGRWNGKGQNPTETHTINLLKNVEMLQDMERTKEKILEQTQKQGTTKNARAAIIAKIATIDKMREDAKNREMMEKEKVAYYERRKEIAAAEARKREINKMLIDKKKLKAKKTEKVGATILADIDNMLGNKKTTSAKKPSSKMPEKARAEILADLDKMLEKKKKQGTKKLSAKMLEDMGKTKKSALDQVKKSKDARNKILAKIANIDKMRENKRAEDNKPILDAHLEGLRKQFKEIGMEFMFDSFVKNHVFTPKEGVTPKPPLSALDLLVERNTQWQALARDKDGNMPSPSKENIFRAVMVPQKEVMSLKIFKRKFKEINEALPFAPVARYPRYGVEEDIYDVITGRKDKSKLTNDRTKEFLYELDKYDKFLDIYKTETGEDPSSGITSKLTGYRGVKRIRNKSYDYEVYSQFYDQLKDANRAMEDMHNYLQHGQPEAEEAEDTEEEEFSDIE